MNTNNEIDHEYTDEMVCPYCGAEESDSWEHTANDGEIECESCEKTFKYYRNIEITYITEKIGEEK